MCIHGLLYRIFLRRPTGKQTTVINGVQTLLYYIIYTKLIGKDSKVEKYI